MIIRSRRNWLPDNTFNLEIITYPWHLFGQKWKWSEWKWLFLSNYNKLYRKFVRVFYTHSELHIRHYTRCHDWQRRKDDAMTCKLSIYILLMFKNEFCYEFPRFKIFKWQMFLHVITNLFFYLIEKVVKE